MEIQKHLHLLPAAWHVIGRDRCLGHGALVVIPIWWIRLKGLRQGPPVSLETIIGNAIDQGE